MLEKTKCIMILSAVLACVLVAGCKSYDDYPAPPMKMKTIYKNDADFHSVPGTDVGEKQLKNVRAAGNIKTYYSGRYVDPNNPDVMYQQSEFYRVEDSPQWNLRPNPSPSPAQRDAAYMHIKNIANASPLAAETELKYKQANSLGTALRYQADQVKKAAETINNQKVEIAKYNENMQTLIKDNRELKEQLLQMQSKMNHSTAKNHEPSGHAAEIDFE